MFRRTRDTRRPMDIISQSSISSRRIFRQYVWSISLPGYPWPFSLPAVLFLSRQDQDRADYEVRSSTRSLHPPPPARTPPITLHRSAHHNTLLWSKSPLHFLEHFSRCKCSLLKLSILFLRSGHHILLCASMHYIRNRNCGCLCFLFWITGWLTVSHW